MTPNPIKAPIAVAPHIINAAPTTDDPIYPAGVTQYFTQFLE